MDVVTTTQKPLLVVIAGPTAVGKTKTAIELAKQINAPILSFDSRQFYKEMTIGTAKPTSEELREAKHYFIDNLSIFDHYTSGKFENDALNLLNELFKTNSIVIAVGGSGLYINALCYGIDEIPTDEKIRNQLIDRWKKEGLEKLQEELKAIDPEFYSETDIQNPRRIIRGLEVFKTSGKPYSFFRKNANKKRDFETLWLGLNVERDILYERINNRVDVMIEQGLENEAKQLYPHKELKPLRTVGYQEFFYYFDHQNGDLNATIDIIKRNTRIFARKQITWFKRNQEIIWLKPDEITEMMRLVKQKISNNIS